MALTSSAALSALILCSMTLLALAARPATPNEATQAEQQAVLVLTSHNRPSVQHRLLQHAARKLLASTPTFDRDLEDRSKYVVNPTLEAAYKRFEAAATDDDSVPFRRLLASSHTSDKDLEDRSAATTNPILTAAVKRLEADSIGSADSVPFRRLLASSHTSDRDLEDRSKAVTNPLLLSAYKKFEADQAGSDIDGTPFRKLLAAA